MIYQATLLRLLLMSLTVAAGGCDQKFDLKPTYATEESYRDQIDYDSLPAETHELYRRTFNGSLVGSKASDYQQLLDTAQRITDRSMYTIYEFQLTDFDRPYEEVLEEGVPFLFVMVQKDFGHIYWCDVSTPEF